MTITEFIQARLTEVEAAAREATAAMGEHGESFWSGVFGAYNEGFLSKAEAEHVALHDPGRELREVAAKRAIIGEQTSDHAPIETAYGLTCRTCVAWQDDEGVHEFGIAIPENWPCQVARSVAAIDSDHPDYDPSWTPNPA